MDSSGVFLPFNLSLILCLTAPRFVPPDVRLSPCCSEPSGSGSPRPRLRPAPGREGLVGVPVWR